MKTLKIMSGLIVILLLMRSLAFAVPPIPVRIGGTVTIDEAPLTDSTDDGYVFKVTKSNGDPYNPAAEDSNGLNTDNWYIIDIPLYEATEQPGGAQPGEQAVIHVYLNGEELTVTNPGTGEFVVGTTGSTNQINVEATMNHPPSVPQLIYPSNGLSGLDTTIEFKWNKASDPDGNTVTYDLYVCEDTSFTLGCINSENIASLNSSVLLSKTGIGLFFIGVVFAGGLGNKRQVANLILVIFIVAISSISCGGGGSDPPPPTPPSEELTQSVSGLKSGTTYYWKVVVTDENDSEAHSETRSFTTS